MRRADSSEPLSIGKLSELLNTLPICRTETLIFKALFDVLAQGRWSLTTGSPTVDELQLDHRNSHNGFVQRTEDTQP
jgi:hypothetical protein